MPFILDDLLLMAALGAGGGAITNKKDPLKGALMGAALGGVGGAVAPGLLGAGGAASGSQAGMLAAQETGAGLLGNMGWGGATTGIQGGLNGALGAEAGASAGGLLSNAGTYAKPIMQGVQTAQAMVPEEQPIHTPNMLPPTSSPNLAQIAGNDQQLLLQQMQEDKTRRERMHQRISAMRGY